MEVGIVVFFKLVALDEVLLDPISVANRFLGVIKLSIDGKELILELLDLVEVFFLLLFFFTLLFFLLVGFLLRLFLVDGFLDRLGFVFVWYESWRSELAGDLSTVLAERL